AAAAVRSGLDRWLSGWVLSLTGDRPPFVLLGAMGSTFVFSMFMSNTATATMMLSVLLPVIAVMDKAARLRTILPVSVAFAANIGGMGTIIGSPPNAIAAGLLQAQDPITFMGWLLAALPVAILLAGVTWLFLAWPVWKDPAVDLSRIVQSSRPILALWQRLVVMTVFTVTVLLWMSGPIHGIPTAVVSFLPITILTMTRTIGVDEIRSLPWDVLLLVAGGLALGVGIEGSGLAAWLVAFLPVDDLGPIGLVLGLAWICSALSNFMSNTAASNILLPISVALGGGQIEYVMPIALAASAAMCLPVSTPPNALAASRAGLRSMDFLPGGLLVGILAAPAAVAACFVYFA
ncbi:MAG: SLC13 family permease, partial [Proteobacteria bacterium]|nr:SLC13 family permease [Pseudomonadota bacterium]